MKRHRYQAWSFQGKQRPNTVRLLETRQRLTMCWVDADLYPHFLPNNGQLGKRFDYAMGEGVAMVLTCWITIKTKITAQDQ